MKRMYEHRDADRVPIMDDPWGATIERWHREGLPQNVDFIDYFGLDRTIDIWVDNGPRYPMKVVEETETYRTATSSWGVTSRNWKHAASSPEFLDFTVIDRDSWQKAKARMTPDMDRVNWEHLKANYASWREKGYWIRSRGLFGYDMTHSFFVGTTRTLMAMVEDPEWVHEMFAHELDITLALLDMVWEAGYEFDEIFWADDMGYKHNQFFSMRTYREILKPIHKRAIDWAHAKGIKAHLHSCGDVNPFVSELVGLGLDALNPLEVKAGMDPVLLKKTYGDALVFHGGINAVLYDNLEALEAQMRCTIPALKEHGGYILSSDHSVPSSVSLSDFQRFVDLGKEIGSYG